MGRSASARTLEENDAEAGRRRRRSTEAAVEELFERQRTPATALPDPLPLMRNLARCAVEIMAGVRDPEQISRWLEPATHSRLVLRAVLAARARQAKGRRASVPAFSLGPCRTNAPADDAVEGVVVVHSSARSRAVVVRLVGIDGRWRASELTVL